MFEFLFVRGGGGCWFGSMGAGVVPACRCCTTACSSTSSVRKSSSGRKGRQSVQVQAVIRSVHLPWSARLPWLSLHSVGCSSRDSAAQLPAPGLTRLGTPVRPFSLPIPCSFLSGFCRASRISILICKIRINEQKCQSHRWVMDAKRCVDMIFLHLNKSKNYLTYKKLGFNQ